MTEMQRHADLQSEVRGTQHVLVALLQERLATETQLKAARAELEHVTRVLEQARSAQARQVVEFNSVVQGAIAEGKTLAAEIEELVRRRDAEIEHQPSGALNARLCAVPSALPIELIPPAPPASVPSAPDADVAPSPVALPPVTPPAPLAAPAVRLSVTPRSAGKRLTPFRFTTAHGHVRVHRPSWRQLANLFIGSILVLLAILLTPVSQVVGGLQLLAVMSGSMEPTIQVGGIVGVRPVAATDLEVGDVITFATQANPDVLVTHRIVSLETRDGQMMVTTKGDANNTIDAMAAPADHAVGRVDFSLPRLGYLMVWLASPVAKILILVVTVISFALPSVKRAPEPAAAGPKDGATESSATSYAVLEDEIQALLSPQP